MTSDTAAVSRSPALRPEVILAVLGLLTFALVPIHINTIYSGLPAHPLFLHVPVILIPVVVVAALCLVVRPRWFVAHGVWIALLAVIALGALNLTMGAGNALRADLGLNGGFGPAALVARHAHAASILRILTILFTAVLIVSVAVFRTADRRITGIGLFDAPLAWVRSSAPLAAALRVLLAVLALASAYFVFHTGDLGAKAVWQGRVSGSHPGGYGGPGGPGGPSSLFGNPSGG
ncbi:MAG: DUF2231 domain-containing protein [Solirubrobacteraceae bacterium]